MPVTSIEVNDLQVSRRTETVNLPPIIAGASVCHLWPLQVWVDTMIMTGGMAEHISVLRAWLMARLDCVDEPADSAGDLLEPAYGRYLPGLMLPHTKCRCWHGCASAPLSKVSFARATGSR